MKTGTLAALFTVATCASAIAQTPPSPSPSPSPAAEEARSTGLPHGVHWQFNLDASWANFGFANSLYTNPKPEEPSGDLSDNWFEGAVTPALTGTWTAHNSS